MTLQQFSGKNVQLGFCEPPEPIYIYIGADGESPWYFYDIAADRKRDIPQKAICGIITEIRLPSKEFKGRESVKLDICVSADELYIIRTGIETTFARGFLLAIAQVSNLQEPLIISPTPGEEKAVFCRLYHAATKQRIKAEWDRDLNCLQSAKNLQSRLVSGMEYPTFQPIVQPETVVQPETGEVLQFVTKEDWLGTRQLLSKNKWTTDMVNALLNHFGVSKAGDLSKAQNLEIRAIAVDPKELARWQQDCF